MELYQNLNKRNQLVVETHKFDKVCSGINTTHVQ